MRYTRDSSYNNLLTDTEEANRIITQGSLNNTRSGYFVQLQNSYQSQHTIDQSIGRQQSSYILTKRLLDQMNSANQSRKKLALQ